MHVVRNLLEMIKFSHTIFAFPFALAGVMLAVRASGELPTGLEILWICLAMVGGRTAAMGLNRIIDAGIDAMNPRTQDRHIPAGRVSRGAAWSMTVGAAILFHLSAWMLNPLCFYLSPIAMGGFLLYPYCKRFTASAHIVLGACLAAAPAGAWIALRGDVGIPILLFSGAVLLWVTGFDIFYALQDREFDAEQGLHSIPVRLGERNAILLAKILHGGTVLLFILTGIGLGLGIWYYLGVAVASALLAYEHQLVKPGDLSRLDAAFFTMNGYISITIFVATALDVLGGM